VPSGTEVRRFPAHPGGAGVGVFSPDGRYALSGGIFDGTVRLWRLPP
jgi:WD40 repeat protein